MKIGIIIADIEEYKPFAAIARDFKGVETEMFGYTGHEINLPAGHTLCVLLCGIGKVNAAAAAAYLVSLGAEAILNCGLSGGLNGILPGEITVGTRYVEHDFDLTPLGLKPAEKPRQEYIYSADNRLLRAALEVCPKAKQGVMVCGDCFISDSKKAAYLIDTFEAMSCDMESAAVASVCHRAGVPFLAIRQISDGGDESAAETYTEANNSEQAALSEIVMKMLPSLE